MRRAGGNPPAWTTARRASPSRDETCEGEFAFGSPRPGIADPTQASFTDGKWEDSMVSVNRREALALGGAGFLSELLLGGGAQAQTSDKLTIAFNVNLPSFDPTVGPSAVNPSIQAIYRAIYDQYIGQSPDLSF